MQQFADGENNFTFYIPGTWDVFGPDHNGIGSQFIMGPEGTSWTANEPAAVQISVIDPQVLPLDQALDMLCHGCVAVPKPQPATLSNGLPVLQATGERPGPDAQSVALTIVEFGSKTIIFAVNAAKAGMDADTLLATFGPFDGTQPAGENTGRGLYAGNRLRAAAGACSVGERGDGARRHRSGRRAVVGAGTQAPRNQADGLSGRGQRADAAHRRLSRGRTRRCQS